MRIVRCNSCGRWIGYENELDTLHTDCKDEDGEYIDYESCPLCGSINGLMDLDRGCYFEDKEIMELWLLFGDVPIDDKDNTEEEFLGFPAGTYRFDIWNWFDEKYSKGVHALTTRETN